MTGAPSDPGVSAPPQAVTTEVSASNFSITSPVRVSSSGETWSQEVPVAVVCIPDSTSIIHMGLQRATCHSDSLCLSFLLNKTCSPLTTEKGLRGWRVFTLSGVSSWSYPFEKEICISSNPKHSFREAHWKRLAPLKLIQQLNKIWWLITHDLTIKLQVSVPQVLGPWGPHLSFGAVMFCRFRI